MYLHIFFGNQNSLRIGHSYIGTAYLTFPLSNKIVGLLRDLPWEPFSPPRWFSWACSGRAYRRRAAPVPAGSPPPCSTGGRCTPLPSR